MTAETHTPAPWVMKSEPYEDGTPYVVINAGPLHPISGGSYNDETKQGFRITAIMSEADGRLIAGAPGLLLALSWLLGLVESPRNSDDYKNEMMLAKASAHAAIAHAVNHEPHPAPPGIAGEGEV